MKNQASRDGLETTPSPLAWVWTVVNTEVQWSTTFRMRSPLFADFLTRLYAPIDQIGFPNADEISGTGLDAR